MRTIAVLLVLTLARWASAEEYLKTPFATVAVAGIDRLQDDLNQLKELTGNHRPASQFLELQSKLGKLPGVDRARTIGGLLFLDQDKLQLPGIVVLLPAKNGTRLINDLKQKFPVIQTISPGKWRINLPNMVLFVEQKEDYLAISPKRPLLALVTGEHLERMVKETQNHDLFAAINFAGMSNSLRERILQGVNTDLDREAERKSEESDRDFLLRSHLIELVRQTVTDVVRETSDLSLKINFDRQIQAEIDWNAVADSKLALVLTGLNVTDSAFRKSEAELPLEVQLGLRIPEPVQSLLLEVYQAAKDQIKQEVGPHLAAADRGPIAGAFDSIERTIQAGVLNGVVAVHETSDGHMVLAGGIKVVDEELLQTSLATVLPYTRESEDIAEVELNAASIEGQSIHRLRGKTQRKEDRRIYGENASLFVGTGPSSFWLAAGGASTPDFFSHSFDNRSHASPTLATVSFSFDPWLQLAERNQQDLKKVARVRKAIPDGTQDHLLIEIKSTPTGLQGTLLAEEGYFKLLGESLRKNESEDSERKQE